jgi:two-component system sensor histidine kinase/response regulator
MSKNPRFPLLREFLRRFAPLAPVGIVAGGYVVLTSSGSEALLFGSSAMEGILFGLGILGALAVGTWAWTKSDSAHLRAQQALLDRLALSGEILNSVRDLVLVADEFGAISYISPSVESMLGYEPDEAMGDGWWELTRETEADREEEKAAAARHARGEREEEWGAPYDRRIRHRDGTYRWIRWRESPGPGRTIVGIGSDVTERREGEETRKRLVALIDNTSQFVGYARPSGEVEFVNPGGRRLVGLEQDPVTSDRSLLDFIDPLDRDRFRNKVFPVVISGESWSGELHLVDFSGGEAVPVHGSIFPVMDEETMRPLALGGTFLDLRDQKSLEASLIEALHRAEDASRAKQQFLANMSHEIRTPMNAIIGMADLLWDTPLTDDQRDYVKIFRTAGETLLVLINDILDLAKVEEGKLDLEEVGFNLPDLLESTVEVFAASAQHKGLEIVARIEPGVPAWVVGDPGRLRQILSNLLGNAVKFTQTGEVVAGVLVEGSGRDEGIGAEAGRNASVHLEFSISDTGVGIPEDQVEAVFGRFTQVDSSTTRRFGGSGLGLAICERLVGLMKGRIWVESEEGTGSTFRFSLSLPVTEGPGEGSVDTSDLTGLKTLVIDDNATNRLILREVLASWGVRVGEASDGASGLEEMWEAMASGTPYRLLLLDGQMPDMDGYSVAERVRDDHSLGRPRIIMLTSHGNLLEPEQVEELQLAGHMMKPVRRFSLLHAIGRAVGRRRLPGPEERKRVIGEPAAETVRPLKVLIVDDSEDNRTLLKAYLKKTPHRLEFAENGQEAVDRVQHDSNIDLVLMDVQMPVMDGHTATRTIRAWEQEKGLEPMKIFALSAHALEEEIRESLAAGCDRHLTKPIKKKTLLDALAAVGEELEVAVNGADAPGEAES